MVGAGFVAKFEEVGGRIASNFFLRIVRSAFVRIMPIILAGSLGVLLNNVIAHPDNGLAQFNGFHWLTELQSIFSAVQFATMNFLAIYLVFAVAYSTAEELGADMPWFSGMVGIASYVTLIPTTQIFEVDGAETIVNNVVLARFTNAQGMFLSLIVGLASSMILHKLLSSGKVSIKMPDSVPPNVSKAFEVMIPTALIIIFFSVATFVFELLLDMNMFDAILNSMQQPLNAAMQHPIGIFIMIFVAQAFWMIGIHGAQLVSIVRDPVGFASLDANIYAFSEGLAGTELPYVWTRAFWDVYSTAGGSGATLGLVIAIILFARRKDTRMMGKLSLVPSLFNINEPLIFGLPIVLNPIFAIPFILAPIVASAIGYFFTVFGWASPAFVLLPWTTPPFINAFLTTGSFGAVIAQFLGVVATVVIYWPFMVIHERMENKKEEERKSSNTAIA